MRNFIQVISHFINESCESRRQSDVHLNEAYPFIVCAVYMLTLF